MDLADSACDLADSAWDLAESAWDRAESVWDLAESTRVSGWDWHRRRGGRLSLAVNSRGQASEAARQPGVELHTKNQRFTTKNNANC